IIISGIIACLLVFVFKYINFNFQLILLFGLIIISFSIFQFNKRKKVVSSSTVFSLFGDCAEDEEFREFFIPLFEECFLIGRKELSAIEGFILLRDKRLADLRLRQQVLNAIKPSSNDQ
ncbi:hypothetical protein, partial [Serratia sp. 121840015-1]